MDGQTNIQADRQTDGWPYRRTETNGQIYSQTARSLLVRKTDRQIDWVTDRQADTQTDWLMVLLTDRHIHTYTKGWPNGWSDRPTHIHTHTRTYRRMAERMVRQTDRHTHTHAHTDGWPNGWLDRQTDRHTHTQRDGRTDGQTDRQTAKHLVSTNQSILKRKWKKLEKMFHPIIFFICLHYYKTFFGCN
jgi:hypothetical protein